MYKSLQIILTIIITFSFSHILVGQDITKPVEVNSAQDIYNAQASSPAISFKVNINTLAKINEETDGRNSKFGSLSLTKSTSPVGTDMSNKIWIDRDDQLMFGTNPISGWWTFSGGTLSFPSGYMVLGNSITQANNATIFNVLGRAKVHSFRMADGTEGDGKVLTSDANGVGTWQTSLSGGSIDALFDGKSTIGSGNVYLGEYAGYTDNSTNAKFNVGIGQWTLTNLGTSAVGENTAIGGESMKNFSYGNSNTAVGYQSLIGNSFPVGGNYNTAIGAESMTNYNSGNQNTAIGYQALYGGTSTAASGSENTAIGHEALRNNFSGTGNVAIGFEAGRSENESNKLYIHNGDAGETSLIYGDFQSAQLTINGKLRVTQGIYGTVYAPSGWPSDIRYKKNINELTGSLNNVLNLKGVSYDWRKDEFPSENFSDGKQIGLIAQEVEKVLPELVLTNEDGYKSVEYFQLTAVLIEAVKEQQKLICELQKQNSEALSQNSDLGKRLSDLESLLKTKRFTQAN